MKKDYGSAQATVNAAYRAHKDAKAAMVQQDALAHAAIVSAKDNAKFTAERIAFAQLSAEEREVFLEARMESRRRLEDQLARARAAWEAEPDEEVVLEERFHGWKTSCAWVACFPVLCCLTFAVLDTHDDATVDRLSDMSGGVKSWLRRGLDKRVTKRIERPAQPKKIVTLEKKLAAMNQEDADVYKCLPCPGKDDEEEVECKDVASFLSRRAVSRRSSAPPSQTVTVPDKTESTQSKSVNASSLKRRVAQHAAAARANTLAHRIPQSAY